MVTFVLSGLSNAGRLKNDRLKGTQGWGSGLWEPRPLSTYGSLTLEWFVGLVIVALLSTIVFVAYDGRGSNE